MKGRPRGSATNAAPAAARAGPGGGNKKRRRDSDSASLQKVYLDLPILIVNFRVEKFA